MAFANSGFGIQKNRLKDKNRVLNNKSCHKIRLPLFMAAFLFSALLPCAYTQDKGDALIIGSISDARTLIGILASDTASSEICAMVYNGLVKYDKDINLTGDLAQSWDIEDNGLTIIFHLKKGVRWHDGHPFSAQDVEFTYKKLIDPLVRTPYSADFIKISHVEVIDSYTIKISYKEPFSPGLASWGMPILPKHLLEKEDLNTTKFARSPIGTGPYKLKSWKSQEKIELIANDDYFEKPPYISRCIYRVIPDESTLFLELLSLGIDIGALTPLQYIRQTESDFFKKNYMKFSLDSFSYTYLGYNLKSPFFNDIRVRQALNLAVDKDKIIKGVLLGKGLACTGPFVAESWAYNPQVKPQEYSLEKAKTLLEEAGWLDTDKDGYLDKGGITFEFSITTNQGNLNRQYAAQIIQSELKSAGIKVKIKVIEWSAFLQLIDKRNFDAVLLGWSLGRDPDCYDIWHSSKVKEGEFNFIGYSNPQVDKLLDEGRLTFDQEKRKIIYREIHKILYQEQPYMFLFSPDSLTAITNRITGIKRAPIGIYHNFIDWWVQKDKQRYKSLIQY